MTVQELIDQLLLVEDKSKVVKNTNGVIMNAIKEKDNKVIITN